MQQSGTKLVLSLVSLAFLFGVLSWWYRYEAAHQASQFWGPGASRLITESKNLEAIDLEPDSGNALGDQLLAGAWTDLSQARGQAHLRHAFLSDRNFSWDKPLDASTTSWRWCLHFYEGKLDAYVLLSEDLEVIGKFTPEADSVTASPRESLSCEPMAASLKQYFGALGLLAKTQSSASTSSE